MSSIDKQHVIDDLDELTADDPEDAHSTADALICDYLVSIGHKEVADAWGAACKRTGFRCG